MGRPGVGGDDREVVLAIAQRDVEDLEVAVRDAARQRAAGDDGVAAHAKAGQVIGCQYAHVVGRAVAIEDIEGIDLRRLVDPGVEVDRAVEVVVARLRRVELAGLDDSDLADRRDVGRRDKGLAGEVGDDHPRAIGSRREGDDAAGNDALAQFARHVGEGLALPDHVGVGGGEGAVVKDDGPDLAREQGVGLEVHQRRRCRDRDRGKVRQAKASALAVDDEEGGAVGDGGESVRRVDVDGGRERAYHVRRQIGGTGGVGVLRGDIADP